MTAVTSRVRRLFEEAHRRMEMFGKRDGKTLSDAWLGLGSPSEYKPAFDAGLMVPVHSAIPRARVKNWWRLTPAGETLYRTMFADAPLPYDGLRADAINRAAWNLQ